MRPRPVRPSLPAIAATVFASGAIVACGLTADFSGLQGGSPGARDAGSGDDAGNGGGPTDAAVTGSIDAAVGDGGFCASLSPAPRLCADFDEGRPVDTGWTAVDVTQNATVKVDSIGFSPPGSMLSAVTPADVPASARLQEAVPLQTTQLHLELEMLLPSAGGPFELIAVHETAPDGTDYGLFYKEEQGSLLVYVAALQPDGGLAQEVYPLGAPSAQWLHVTIDFGIGDDGSVVVRHDGAVVINATGVPTATAGATQYFVALGLYSPDAATARVNFDDVIVDWP